MRYYRLFEAVCFIFSILSQNVVLLLVVFLKEILFNSLTSEVLFKKGGKEDALWTGRYQFRN